MALPTTGAISLSQLVAEFGGVAPHAMSEFYALSGKGVTGLPSSGVFNCSQFYGKSNQVITSVWTASGYNQTSLQELGSILVPNQYVWVNRSGNNGMIIQLIVAGVYYNNVYQVTVGGTTYYGTGYSNGSAIYRRTRPITTWIDTSAYQNTTTTAQITT